MAIFLNKMTFNTYSKKINLIIIFLVCLVLACNSSSIKMDEIISSFIRLLIQDQFEYTKKLIANILKRFPQRKFALVGDSGEKNPEVYAFLAKNNPNVIAVLIRDLDHASQANKTRFDKLIQSINRKLIFKAFKSAKELSASFKKV